MAFPTPVNSQITDSAAPNAPVDAGIAMGQIYQSLAHSTGILFENAVSAQQQLQIAAQAATNQGVIQIYSVDTASTTTAAEKVAQSDAPDTLLSLLTALHAKQADTMAAMAEITAPAASANGEMHTDDLRVANAVREAASALQAAMEATARALQATHRHILRNAALSATMNAMIRTPGQADAYAPVLKVISELA